MLARSRRGRHDRLALGLRRPRGASPKQLSAIGLAATAVVALAAPSAAAAAPTLTLTRACAVSVPVDAGTHVGAGIAFVDGSGFTPNGAATINYPQLPQGATAPTEGNPPAYYEEEADPSGAFGPIHPPRVSQGTRPQILPGQATVVAKDLDSQASSNSVSFSVAVAGTTAAKKVHKRAKLHIHAFGVGLIPTTGSTQTAFAHFVQGNQVVATRKLGPPAGACATVATKVKPPKPGSYTLLVDTIPHPSGTQLDNPTYSTKVKVKR